MKLNWDLLSSHLENLASPNDFTLLFGIAFLVGDMKLTILRSIFLLQRSRPCIDHLVSFKGYYYYGKLRDSNIKRISHLVFFASSGRAYVSTKNISRKTCSSIHNITHIPHYLWIPFLSLSNFVYGIFASESISSLLLAATQPSSSHDHQLSTFHDIFQSLYAYKFIGVKVGSWRRRYIIMAVCVFEAVWSRVAGMPASTEGGAKSHLLAECPTGSFTVLDRQMLFS